MKAKLLIEKYRNLKSTKKKVNEEEAPIEQSPVQEAISWLKEKCWSESNMEQTQAADQMKMLAESDDQEANKFMEYMDGAASKYMEEMNPEEEPMQEEGEEGEEGEEEKEDEEQMEEEEMEEPSDEEEVEDEEEMEEEGEVEEPSDEEEMEDEEDEEEAPAQSEKFKKVNWKK